MNLRFARAIALFAPLMLGAAWGCADDSGLPGAAPVLEDVRAIDAAAVPTYRRVWGVSPVGEGDGGDIARPGSGAVAVTPWPTFTPVPTPEPTPEPAGAAGRDDGVVTVPGDGDVAGPVAPGRRFTCRVDFRRWLVATKWRTARDLDRGMADFRALRPDCNAVVFAPEFSAGPRCRDGDRVGGVRVGSFFSRGEAHNYDLELLGTRKSGAGDMLVHFARLPERTGPGCWYYQARAGRWLETVPGGSGSAAAVPAPTAAPVAGGFRVCDDALRRRFASEPDLVNALLMQSVIDQVATGLAECSAGWEPRVSEARLAARCPVRDSGWAADGSIVVHWSGSPGDGASCWVYDPSSGEWESR